MSALFGAAVATPEFYTFKALDMLFVGEVRLFVAVAWSCVFVVMSCGVADTACSLWSCLSPVSCVSWTDHACRLFWNVVCCFSSSLACTWSLLRVVWACLLRFGEGRLVCLPQFATFSHLFSVRSLSSLTHTSLSLSDSMLLSVSLIPVLVL